MCYAGSGQRGTYHVSTRTERTHEAGSMLSQRHIQRTISPVHCRTSKNEMNRALGHLCAHIGYD